MGAVRIPKPSRIAITSREPFIASTPNKAGSTYNVKGIDEVDGRLIAIDASNGLLRQSSDWAVTWSNSKTLPTNVVWSDFGAVVRFGSFLYALAKDNVTGLHGVYRAAPQSGNTAFSWSAQLQTFTTGSSSLLTCLAADASYIYAVEYGDPVGGPSVYRSADGSAWTQILGPVAAWRHIHAIACDPYNAGHVWLTTGDGVSDPIKYSTDYGATWTAVQARSGYIPQCVQISFSPEWVFLAADASYATVFVVDRGSKQWRGASRTFHANMAIPGNVAGNVFDASPLYGVVDPSSGVYYCSTPTSGGWPVPGLWALPEVGGDMHLVTTSDVGSRMFVSNGRLWYGTVNRRLWTTERVA